jgi:GNAT superfamily N-acetyltransferase
LASSTEPPWIIELLNRQHDRGSFDCGDASLNDWLKLRAGLFAKKDLARTYIASRRNKRDVVGYYAISAHRVSYESLPADQAKRLPRIDVPVVLLGKLAVARSMQGQGLGSFLLLDALRRTLRLADAIGIRAMEVDAIDEAARQFYLKFGFVSLADSADHLFLPVHVIRHLPFPTV